MLDELNLDMWLIFVRETPVMADPALDLAVGHTATWQSLFAYTRHGDAVALVGSLDAADFEAAGHFTEVATYVEGVAQDIRALISRFDPKTIALNYSADNPSADGLTHGMYCQLREYLAGTPYPDRFTSAETLLSKLRSRKLPTEINALRAAAAKTTAAWEESLKRIDVGMTEKEVAAVIDADIAAQGGEPSFETIVNAGDKTSPGHGSPTNAKLAPGDLLHVDFGVRADDYCADLQRLVYFKRRGEAEAPPELIEAFATVRDIITATGQMCRPGVKGYEVDAIARETLVDNGYPEYQHALGHQLGRAVHDGGASIGPKWERYGNAPSIPLETNNVTTLELEIILPGIGCVGLEEDVRVTENGAEFLCARQLELIVR